MTSVVTSLLFCKITTSSPWSYAIHLTNDSNPDEDLKFQNNGLLSGVPPFSIKGAPSKITATVRKNNDH